MCGSEGRFFYDFSSKVRKGLDISNAGAVREVTVKTIFFKSAAFDFQGYNPCGAGCQEVKGNSQPWQYQEESLPG